jgi:uncharacterized protein YbjT (DUF2867 family)
MKRILVAGATGYLGRYLVKVFSEHGYQVRALARDPKKLDNLNDHNVEIFEGEVTKQETLKGICDDIGVVISTIGITRQKDNLTYMDVDYQGNKNLLDLAVETKVTKFVYVSVLNAHLMKDLKIIQAKERFVDDLKQSGLAYAIIRPTGFFSDMLEFFEMAKKGRIYLFGSGENKINPIHGNDLAEVCVNAIDQTEKEIGVGGPTVYTYRGIAELAFSILNKYAKISTLPIWIKDLTLFLLRTFTSSKTYGPLEFLMTALTVDGIGTSYGKEELKDFFEQNI